MSPQQRGGITRRLNDAQRNLAYCERAEVPAWLRAAVAARVTHLQQLQAAQR